LDTTNRSKSVLSEQKLEEIKEKENIAVLTEDKKEDGKFSNITIVRKE
jgi:hypothetical protein